MTGMGGMSSMGGMPPMGGGMAPMQASRKISIENQLLVHWYES